MGLEKPLKKIIEQQGETYSDYRYKWFPPRVKHYSMQRACNSRPVSVPKEFKLQGRA